MTGSRRRCLVCGHLLARARTGRPKSYCSDSCRLVAWRARPRQLSLFAAAHALADDVDPLDSGGPGTPLPPAPPRAASGRSTGSP